MTGIVEWRYEVTEDRDRWRCAQYRNGQLLKCTWRDTEAEGQELCKAWAAVAAG